MTRKATSKRRLLTEGTDESLDHYTVDEAAAKLKISRRWLAGKAAERSIECTYVAGKLRFTAEHIRAISRAGEVDPARYGRRSAAA